MSTISTTNSPAEHHDEVHDVPAVPQVGAFVEDEAQGHQLDARLEAEGPDEVGLRLLLWGQRRGAAVCEEDEGQGRCPHQSLGHGGLVLPGEVLLQGQDHAVGGDGGQDHVLKRNIIIIIIIILTNSRKPKEIHNRDVQQRKEENHNH
ncbi:hypothetical protein EYF80_024814 [Liparis tanakae]|uniref:Uncharacterized protein n=1 Tax=Liparis tanakae TaxID=230148 RepID=A0A4Z2HHC5_9TELE|nr:hypothetical protein EYF80_024814 [Liparis tanakae]